MHEHVNVLDLKKKKRYIWGNGNGYTGKCYDMGR